MAKIKFVDKEFWKYKGLLVKTAWSNWVSYFEGWKKIAELFIVAIFTALCSIVALYIFRRSATMSDWWIIVISSIGGVFLFGLMIFVGKLLYASYEIINEKDSELEKFNWKKIKFDVCQYDVFKDVGWAIRVINNKKINARLILELDYLRAGDNLDSPTIRRHYLGNIEENGKKVKNRIVCKSSGITEVESGGEKVFPLTKVSESQVSFLTFPEDERRMEFPLTKSGVLLTIQADIETEEGNFPLLGNKLEIYVLPDGSISPLDKENKLWA